MRLHTVIIYIVLVYVLRITCSNNIYRYPFTSQTPYNFVRINANLFSSGRTRFLVHGGKKDKKFHARIYLGFLTGAGQIRRGRGQTAN
jgi:hypothetical protein